MSLSDLKNDGEICAEVRMIRTNFSGAILLVEGPDDGRFFRPRVNNTTVNIVICNGKANAVAAINKLNAKNVTGVVAAVDDDFDQVCGITSPANVIKTDTHDIETMMLSSDAFALVLNELGDQAKTDAFERSSGCSVQEALIDRASHFGRLRLLNNRPGGFLADMENTFRPGRFMEERAWQLDLTKLQACYAETVGVTVAELQAMIAGLPEIPAWNLIQGHDALLILAMGLKIVLGRGQQSEKSVCLAFRLAFSKEMFQQSALGQGLRNWENASAPFVLF